MWQFPCIDWPKIPRTYFARWLKATCWDHFFALCSVAYVHFFLTFSNLLLSAWGRTFPLAGSQPLTFEARFQRPASCATAGIFEILRKSKISQNIFFLSSTSLTHVCLIYCAGWIYPTNYTATVSQSHFSSVDPSLRDLNSRHFTDWATAAAAVTIQTWNFKQPDLFKFGNLIGCIKLCDHLSKSLSLTSNAP